MKNMMKSCNIRFIQRILSILAVVLILSGVILSSCMILSPASVLAADTAKQYVTDDASIFTTAERQKLEDLCQKTSENCKTDIVIITMKQGMDGSVLDNYVRAILEKDYGYQGSGADCDAIAYVIDMKSRADRIVTSGNTRHENITQKQLDKIRESAEKKLTNGSYYSGCVKYIDGVEHRMNKSLSYRLTTYMPIKLLISLAVAVVTVLVMMVHAKSKMTVGCNTYVKDHQGNLLARDDQYINTTVVTRHIQSSSGSGGSGGGGGGGNSGSSGGHF